MGAAESTLNVPQTSDDYSHEAVDRTKDFDYVPNVSESVAFFKKLKKKMRSFP